MLLFLKLFSSILGAVSTNCLVVLNLAAIGHFVAVELRATLAGLRGRLLQSWVKSGNPGRDKPQGGGGRVRRGPAVDRPGFLANEWLASDEFGWMTEAKLEEFFGQLEELRSRVEALAASDLVECAKAMVSRC